MIKYNKEVIKWLFQKEKRLAKDNLLKEKEE